MTLLATLHGVPMRANIDDAAGIVILLTLAIAALAACGWFMRGP